MIWQGCPLRQVRVHLLQRTQVIDVNRPRIPGGSNS
jgi:hypothetical protein